LGNLGSGNFSSTNNPHHDQYCRTLESWPDIVLEKYKAIVYNKGLEEPARIFTMSPNLALPPWKDGMAIHPSLDKCHNVQKRDKLYHLLH
jgi:hypothetical protein